MNLNIQDYSIFPPKIPGNWNMGCQSSCYFAPDGRFCWGMLYRLVRVIRDGVDPTHPLPRPRRGYQGTPKNQGFIIFSEWKLPMNWGISVWYIPDISQLLSFFDTPKSECCCFKLVMSSFSISSIHFRWVPSIIFGSGGCRLWDAHADVLLSDGLQGGRAEAAFRWFGDIHEETMLYTLWWTNVTMERSAIFNGKTHYKWPCSIAMLNYQRVNDD